MTIYYNENTAIVTAFIGDDEGRSVTVRVLAPHRASTSWAILFIPHKERDVLEFAFPWGEDYGGRLRDRFRLALTEMANQPDVKRLGITRLLRAFE